MKQTAIYLLLVVSLVGTVACAWLLCHWRKRPTLGMGHVIDVEGYIAAHDWTAFTATTSTPVRLDRIHLPDARCCEVRSLWIGPPKAVTAIDRGLYFGVLLPGNEVHIVVVNNSAEVRYIYLRLYGREIVK